MRRNMCTFINSTAGRISGTYPSCVRNAVSVRNARVHFSAYCEATEVYPSDKDGGIRFSSEKIAALHDAASEYESVPAKL